MRIRPAVLIALTVSALTAPLAFAGTAAAPQVTDPAGDATFTATAQSGAPGLPVGNQAYADVLSVSWSVDKVVKKKKTTVTGFTVVTTLAAPPVPTNGAVVYRMLGATDACTFFGPVYYTKKSTDPAIPQAALRDSCNAGVTRLTPIPMPTISGSTITWKVPVSAFPKEIKVGTTLTALNFAVNEMEDFGGAQVPNTGQTPYDGAYGLGAGVVDDGKTTASFKIG
jgi:hypothetical protein